MGAGQAIAVIAQTNINTQDVVFGQSDFRHTVREAVPDRKVRSEQRERDLVVLNGTDPGIRDQTCPIATALRPMTRSKPTWIRSGRVLLRQAPTFIS